ncbi:O-antigen ligase family protein [Candidatus Viridilinea mediisalina]|uniref:O-antigen ligase-related domain-containing protein n=1 Tax=Candidatus Viridilinea mediisalina TaxID=2024553 RepID=A0A2A6RG29_9CHLR|nr:O-antigen ligase family protein [Candidatus Viridilinea mediisalina]PDW02027.1 hypothetical protein CJ255_16120 [Candidatus Viridilinea mediisalina]
MEEFLINALLFIIVFVILMVFFRQPEWPLALHVSGFYYYPLIFEILGLETSSLTTLTFYLFLVTGYLLPVFFRRSSKILDVLQTRSSFFLALFTVWMIFNWMFLSFESAIGRDKIIFMFLLAWAPYVGVATFDDKQMHRFLKIIVWLGMLGVVISLVQLFLGSGFSSATARFSITDAANPLGYAYAIGLSVAVLLVFLVEEKRLWVWLVALVYISTSVILIFMSASRGPILALFVSSIFYISQFNGRHRIKIASLVFLSVFLLWYLLPVFISDGFLQRFSETSSAIWSVVSLNYSGMDRYQLITASSGRWIVWQSSISNFIANPIVGVGLGNDRIDFISSSVNVFAHNFVLEIAAELGLIGLILFAGFIFNIFRLLFKMNKYSSDRILMASLTVLFTYSIITMSFSGRLVTVTTFWLACGWISGFAVRSKSTLVTRKNNSRRYISPLRS